MKIVVLMALFILCQILSGLSQYFYRPCKSGEMYHNCSDLCKWGCNWRYDLCIEKCNRGCGCGRSSLIKSGRNECQLLGVCPK